MSREIYLAFNVCFYEATYELTCPQPFHYQRAHLFGEGNRNGGAACSCVCHSFIIHWQGVALCLRNAGRDSGQRECGTRTFCTRVCLLLSRLVEELEIFRAEGGLSPARIRLTVGVAWKIDVQQSQWKMRDGRWVSGAVTCHGVDGASTRSSNTHASPMSWWLRNSGPLFPSKHLEIFW